MMHMCCTLLERTCTMPIQTLWRAKAQLPGQEATRQAERRSKEFSSRYRKQEAGQVAQQANWRAHRRGAGSQVGIIELHNATLSSTSKKSYQSEVRQAQWP
jgi:hypothetical protein